MTQVTAGHTQTQRSKRVLIGGKAWLQWLRKGEEEAEVLMAEVAMKSREETLCQLRGYRNTKANFISVISPLSVGIPALFYLMLGGGQTRHKLLFFNYHHCKTAVTKNSIQQLLQCENSTGLICCKKPHSFPKTSHRNPPRAAVGQNSSHVPISLLFVLI